MDGITGLNFIGTGAKAIASLSFVLALIVLVLIGMKKIAFYRQRWGKGLMVRRVSSIPLSGKERIDVVDISGHRLILGVAQGGISLLMRLRVGDEESRKPNEKED
jgi:flagellar biogenesis protein FliO